MVGMSMGVEHRIDFADALTQGLLAEIGAGVNDDLLTTIADESAAASAAVVGIG